MELAVLISSTLNEVKVYLPIISNLSPVAASQVTNAPPVEAQTAGLDRTGPDPTSTIPASYVDVGQVIDRPAGS